MIHNSRITIHSFFRSSKTDLFAREARIYSSRPPITWLGRSAALQFLPIATAIGKNCALQPIPSQAPGTPRRINPRFPNAAGMAGALPSKANSFTTKQAGGGRGAHPCAPASHAPSPAFFVGHEIASVISAPAMPAALANKSVFDYRKN